MQSSSLSLLIFNLKNLKCDFTIVCNDGELNVNTYMLSAQSEFFKKLFEHHYDNTHKVFLNDNIHTIKIIVDYLQNFIFKLTNASDCIEHKSSVVNMINLFSSTKMYMIQDLNKKSLLLLEQMAVNKNTCRFVYELCTESPHEELNLISKRALSFCAYVLRSDIYRCSHCHGYNVFNTTCKKKGIYNYIIKCPLKINGELCNTTEYHAVDGERMNLSDISYKSAFNILMELNSFPPQPAPDNHNHHDDD